MADVIWPIGTDSSEKLREVVRDYLAERLAANKAQLPKRHFHVVVEGERQRAGVIVIIATQPDDAQAWPYLQEERRVLEERHGLAVIVKADARNGGSESVLRTFGFIRALLNTDAEREALQALGVQNLHETSEGLDGVGGEAVESSEFQRQLKLRATTDTFLT